MAKGGEFERKMAKEISKWWTDGERDDIFWRTAGSGGRATVRAKQGKSTAGGCGDLTATDPSGFPLIDLCTIELKKGYNAWTLKELIDSNKKNCELLGFVQQCERERKEADIECWLLITKQDRKETLLFFDDAFKSVLKEIGCSLAKWDDHIMLSCRKTRFYAVKWNEFARRVKPQMIIDLMES